MRQVLVATNNEGKLKEVQNYLESADFKVISLKDANIDVIVDERGKTFEENAKIKAATYSKYTDLPLISEDSGLEIEALNGFPGVKTARWKEGSDRARNEGILERMSAVKNRKAKFVSAVVFYDKRNNILKTFEGVMNCQIARKPSGTNGFGYDPILFIPELGKTTAEISLEDKNKISHRGKALQKLAGFLQNQK